MKKRLAAIVLAMSLVFGLCAFTAFADEEAYPEAEAGGTYTVYVEEGGIVYYSFTPEESGVYVFYTVSDDDTYMYLYDSDFVLLDEDDDSGDDLNAEIDYYLEAGNTYYIGLSFLSSSDEGSFDFVCDVFNTDEFVIAGEAQAGGTYTVYVEEGGVVYYSITPEESGYYIFYTVSDDDTYMYLYDSNFQLLEENDDGGDDLNAEIDYLLEAGNTYYIGLSFLSSYYEGSFDFVCEEVDIEEAEAGGTYTVYVEEGGIVYYSFTPEESGYYIFYTVSDDDTYMYLYDSDFNILESNDDGGDDLNAKIDYYFEAGSTYFIGFAFYSSSTEGSYEFVCEVYIPAVSAQLILTTDSVELIEGLDSYTEYDENDEEYDYYYFYSDAFSEGDRIVVTYGDGSEETYVFEDYDFYSEEDGGDIGSWYTEDSQYDEHWEVGGTYYVTMYLSDLDYVSVEVPVTIIENPYISALLSLSSAATLEQGTCSFLEYDEEEGAYYDYYSAYYMTFSEGDTVTITCEDGEVIIYTYSIIEETYTFDGEEYINYSEGFVDGEGDELGYYYDYDQSEEHWEVGGTYTVSMILYEYGLTVDIPVTILENPYSGAVVTLNLAGDIVLSECTDAYDRYDDDDEVFSYYSFWYIEFTEGDQIIVTFEDGTTEIYTYSAYEYTYTDEDGTEEIEYDYDFMDEDGNYMYYSVYSTQYYDHWYAGSTYSYIFVIEDYGISFDFPVTVSDHDWTLTEVITAATCTEDGSGTYTCADCGETKTDVIAATGHSWDSGVVTEAATETEDGVMTYTCTVCGTTKTEVIAATGNGTDTGSTDTSEGGTDTGSTDTSEGGTDSTDTSDDEDSSPEVGDANSLALWFALMFIAAAGIGVYMLRRKLD